LAVVKPELSDEVQKQVNCMMEFPIWASVAVPVRSRTQKTEETGRSFHPLPGTLHCWIWKILSEQL